MRDHIQFKKRGAKLLFAFVNIDVVRGKVRVAIDEIRYNPETQDNEPVLKRATDLAGLAAWYGTGKWRAEQ